MFLYYLILDFIILLLILSPCHLFKFHPLILRFILTLYTVTLRLKLNKFNNLYWYSYILYLIIVGGILILFLYLTRISNNELISLNKKYYIYFTLKLFLIILIYLILINLIGKLNYHILYNFIDLINLIKFNTEDLIEYKNLYIKFNLNLNIFLIIYLFFIIITCVLICTKHSFPLRQIIN